MVSGVDLASDGHGLAPQKKGILLEPHPQTQRPEADGNSRLAWGFTCQDPAGVWQGSTMTGRKGWPVWLLSKGCSWCIVGRGRAEAAVQGVLQEDGQTGSKYGHAMGSLAPGVQASHRKLSNQASPAPKCHRSCQQGREPGHGVQWGRQGCFWFLNCRGSAGSQCTSEPESAFIPLEARGSCHLGKDSFVVEFQMTSCCLCLRAAIVQKKNQINKPINEP